MAYGKGEMQLPFFLHLGHFGSQMSICHFGMPICRRILIKAEE